MTSPALSDIQRLHRNTQRLVRLLDKVVLLEAYAKANNPAGFKSLALVLREANDAENESADLQYEIDEIRGDILNEFDPSWYTIVHEFDGDDYRDLDSEVLTLIPATPLLLVKLEMFCESCRCRPKRRRKRSASGEERPDRVLDLFVEECVRAGRVYFIAAGVVGGTQPPSVVAN